MPRRAPDTADIVEFEFELACKGLTQAEVVGIHRALKKSFPKSRVAFRNPAPLSFDAQSVHTMMLVLAPTAALYVGKKVFEKTMDVIATVVQNKLEKNGQQARHLKTVTIYGPDNTPAVEVIVPPIRRR